MSDDTTPAPVLADERAGRDWTWLVLIALAGALAGVGAAIVVGMVFC